MQILCLKRKIVNLERFLKLLQNVSNSSWVVIWSDCYESLISICCKNAARHNLISNFEFLLLRLTSFNQHFALCWSLQSAPYAGLTFPNMVWHGKVKTEPVMKVDVYMANKAFLYQLLRKKSMAEHVVSYNTRLMIIFLQNVVLAEQDRLVHIVLNSGATHWLKNT